MKKLKVGILGATGMVGQRFVSLLENHPWFEVVTVAASENSANKKYKDAVSKRWKMESKIPDNVSNLFVKVVGQDIKEIVQSVDFVFCALDLEKEVICKIEESYASYGVPVISNNSANRWTKDVPMIMPEVNPNHIKLIDIQRKKHGWKKGFIAVKPNCSIQSYVSILTALMDFKPKSVHVVSLQAISGAGKTFETWPEIVDNVIPFIKGEEEKSEKEPLKIWGSLNKNAIEYEKNIKISATCIRVPASNGHMASVSVNFAKRLTEKELISQVKDFNPLQEINLPSSPKQFISYFEEENFPQTRVHRELENGMGISMGRLRKDKEFDYKFIALSHNTIRGAAGGAILMAELLTKKGYIE